MKTTMRVLLAVCVTAIGAGSLYSQQELSSLVGQLQKAPTDSYLREKVIKRAATTNPALPKDAERHMARGGAAFKDAKSVAEYKDAITEFQAAIDAAPWYGDAYFNLGVTLDKAGRFADALQALKWAQMASPDAKDIETLIYEVEYRNEKANSSSAKQAAQQAAGEAKAKRFDGQWQHDFYSRDGLRDRQTFAVSHTSLDSWTFRLQDQLGSGPLMPGDPHFSGFRYDGENLIFRYDRGITYPDHFEVTVSYEVTASTDAGGSELSLSYKPLPFPTAERESNWTGYGYGPPKPYTDVYKRIR